MYFQQKLNYGAMIRFQITYYSIVHLSVCGGDLCDAPMNVSCLVCIASL